MRATSSAIALKRAFTVGSFSSPAWASISASIAAVLGQVLLKLQDRRRRSLGAPGQQRYDELIPA
jgi:hypothetical protein